MKIADFNLNPPSPPNPNVLQNIIDALFVNRDVARALTLLEQQPKNLQIGYILKLEEKWINFSPPTVHRVKPKKFQVSLAFSRFLDEVLNSKDRDFSDEAKAYINLLLQTEELDPSRTNRTEIPERYEKPLSEVFGALKAGTLKYVYGNFGKAIQELRTSPEAREAIEKSLSEKSVLPLTYYTYESQIGLPGFFAASVVYLLEKNETRKANLLFDYIADIGNEYEPLKELYPGIWIRPKASLINNAIQEIISVRDFSSAERSLQIASGLKFDVKSEDLETILLHRFFSLGKDKTSPEIQAKELRAIELISSEDRFKRLNVDLPAYYAFPENWIYSQRFNSRRYKPNKLEESVLASIQNRNTRMKDLTKEEIVSLLMRDLKLEKEHR